MSKREKTQLGIDIGKRIRGIRRDLDLTQNEFSERLNITGSYLSSVENGNQTPSLDVMIRMRTVFDIRTEYLVYGTGGSYHVLEDSSGSPITDTDAWRKEVGEYIFERYNRLKKYVENYPVLRMEIILIFDEYLIENDNIIKKVTKGDE